MMADPEVRAAQERFISFAADRVQLLRDVLRNAAEPDERATAAAVIGYAPRKREVVNDLQYAIQDPDESVRANAMRRGAALDQIRDSALPALAEMARWKTLRYALPSFLLLGRAAGMADAELHQLWEKGEREPVIRQALGQSGAAARQKRGG
jgi:hypothetical protein